MTLSPDALVCLRVLADLRACVHNGEIMKPTQEAEARADELIDRHNTELLANDGEGL